MEQIQSEQHFESVITSETPTVVVFKTTWCPDCRYIDPFMPEIEKKYEQKIAFFEIDRDDYADLCMSLNILGIPSFVAFQNGKETIRFVSKLRKTREEIEQFFNRVIEISEELSQS